MSAPDVVITTSLVVVALHVAVKPATLLAPEATVGITEEAKKLEGYETVRALPERMGEDGEKTRVTEMGDFPSSRSEVAILKVDKMGIEQKISQRDGAVREERTTGVSRSVVEPSPSCRKKNTKSATAYTSPQNTLQYPQTTSPKASPGQHCCFPSTTPRRR
jgi:hypothetical protein